MKPTETPENVEAVRRAYLDEQLSTRQVAANLGLGVGVVRGILKRHGILARTKSEALSGEHNPMFGKPKSEAARLKTSETLKVINQDPVVRRRRSEAVSGTRNPMAGRGHTAESRAKMSQTKIAQCQSPEARRTLSERGLLAWQTPGVREYLTALARQRTGQRNPFFGRSHKARTRAKLSRANRGRFRGAKGSNWQGGKTRVTVLVRNSTPAIQWRKDVFTRDSFTCQACGRVGGLLHADHIEPLAVLIHRHGVKTLADDSCEPLWNLSNGRTLCVPCHKQTPSYGGNFQKNFATKVAV